MKEPSLSDVASPLAEETYRFLWLRSFHHPITVRVTLHSDGSATLIAKMTGGQGGYAPGKITTEQSYEVDPQRAHRAIELVNRLGFWNAPTELPPDGMHHLDGAQWILEGSRDGKYHVIDRWCPERGPLRELGIYLTIDLGKLSVPKSEIY